MVHSPSDAVKLGSPAADAPAAAREHRHRLLEGMAVSVSVKGYGDTTIGDIVRHAAVSRRTFYEHFDTKAECLIALYVASSWQATQVLRESIDTTRPWDGQIEGALRAYLGYLSMSPSLLRTLFVDILALGEPGLAARRRVHMELAQFVQQVANGRPEVGALDLPLPLPLALAIVGGLHELVLHAIEDGRAAELGALVAPACELVRAVVKRVG